jgi:hypothetical protein
MTRLCAVILLFLGAVAATLYGADFWQKKKFTEWSDNEVRRMLSDSPWAHTYELMNGGFASSGGGGGGRGGWRGGGGGGGGGFSAEGGDEGGGGTPSAPGGSMDTSGGRAPRPAAVIQFRMLSALPVKQAIARTRYGNEAETSPDAAKFLARQEPSYVVGIGGLPPGILRGADPASLKNTVQLKVKGKPAAYAQDVRFEKSGPLLDAYIFFSRTDTPIIVEDGEFQVIFKLPDMELKRTFKLKDMVYDGKLEL